MSSPQSQIHTTFYSLICTCSYRPRRIHAPKGGVSSSARSRTTLHRGFCGAYQSGVFSFRTPLVIGPGAQLTIGSLGPCALDSRFNVPLILIWESGAWFPFSLRTPPISNYATAKALLWRFVHRSTGASTRNENKEAIEATAKGGQ